MLITIKNLTSNSLSTSVGAVLPHATVEFDVTEAQYSQCIDSLLALEQGKLLELTVAGDRQSEYALFNGIGTTDRALTLYVETTGDDANPGTKGLPFKTIQAAINLLPDTINNPVVIYIGEGTFVGFRVDGKVFGKPQTSDGTYLSIAGTLGTVTPSSGPSTGTVSTLNAVNSTALSSFTITGATWATDELKGKFIRNETLDVLGADLIPIVSNTADTIYYYCYTGYIASGNTVTIVEPKTHITDAAGLPLSAYLPVYGSEGNALVRVTNITNTSAHFAATSPALSISNMHITANANSIVRLRIETSQVRLSAIVTDGTGTSFHIVPFNSYLSVDGWVSLGSGNGVNCPTASKLTTLLALNLVFMERSIANTGISGTHMGQYVDMYLKGCSTGITLQDSNTSLTRCAFEGCTTAISANNSNNYTKPYRSNLGFNGGFFTDNTLCFDLQGLVWAQCKFAGGTGNTTLANVKFGARFGFRTDFNPAAATEIVMDQATTTLAAVRGATPKAVTDAVYGSIAYETV